MLRRLLLLIVPLAVFAGACSSDDSPTVDSPTTVKRGTSSTAGSSTTGGSTTLPGPGTSTTTPSGPGIAMTGAEGSGTVAYSLAPERSEFCYRITVEDSGASSDAHVHRGPAGETGEVVLNLTPPTEDGTVNTCSAADSIFIQELEAAPSDFYVDVHGAKGVLRAQLR